MALLRHLLEKAGVGVTEISPIRDESGEVYSSTRVREYLEEGRPDLATSLLGHTWTIEGTVHHGEKRGKAMGFPTANIIFPHDLLHPKHGVYAVRGKVVGENDDEQEWLHGVANFGIRPTVDGKTESLETHFFDFSDDLYGKKLQIQLVKFMRAEIKFDDTDALTAQIAEDTRKARHILREHHNENGKMMAGADHLSSHDAQSHIKSVR